MAVNRGARPDLDPDACFRNFFQLMYGEMSAGFPPGVFRAFTGAARRAADTGTWTPLSVMPGAVTQTHRDWLAAVEQRERYRAAWHQFFQGIDVLITPVAPTVAMPHDQRAFEARTIRLGDRDYAYMQQAFWCALATSAGLPAAVVPVGLDPEGMPVGLQVIAPYLGDHTALEFAGLVERLTGGFREPPSREGAP